MLTGVGRTNWHLLWSGLLNILSHLKHDCMDAFWKVTSGSIQCIRIWCAFLIKCLHVVLWYTQSNPSPFCLPFFIVSYFMFSRVAFYFSLNSAWPSSICREIITNAHRCLTWFRDWRIDPRLVHTLGTRGYYIFTILLPFIVKRNETKKCLLLFHVKSSDLKLVHTLGTCVDGGQFLYYP